MSKEEAYRQVSGPPISDSRDRKGNSSIFYQYCRQHGLWPKGVSGWDPHSEVEKFVPYLPVRNVTKDYPPTMLIHGTNDTDVPYEQSVMMAQQFREHGVEHKLVAIPGGKHGLGGGDPTHQCGVRISFGVCATPHGDVNTQLNTATKLRFLPQPRLKPQSAARPNPGA